MIEKSHNGSKTTDFKVEKVPHCGFPSIFHRSGNPSLAICQSAQGVCLRYAYREVCPNFGHPALTSSFQVYALSRCCVDLLRK